MAKEYVVVPLYSKEIPKGVQSMFLDSYVKMRNEAVEMINPHYEEWNAEYDRLYPVKLKPEEAEYKRYNAFIAEKHKPFLAKANKSLLFELFTDLESGDIACRIKGTDIICRISLKER